MIKPTSVNLSCRVCDAKNRIPTERALEDLTSVLCGACKAGILRVHGEPLVGLANADLSHPWDKQALDALRAVPYADKLLSKMFSATLDKMARFNLLANTVRVNEAQAPRLWALYLEAAGRIDIDPPPLFIAQNPTMNAFAAGAGSPVVSVTSGLLDGMGDREILGVLGHELTHVKLGHVLYRTLAVLMATGGLNVLDKLLGIGRVLVLPIQMALMRWSQMSELSADRGELLTSGSLEVFIRTHMLLAGGTSRFIEDLDVGAFVEQAHEAETMRDTDFVVMAFDTMSNVHRTHPLPAWRVHHGLKWAQTPAFFEILAGKNPGRLESQ
jgi:Zn-dependent protease with chaperone function